MPQKPVAKHTVSDMGGNGAKKKKNGVCMKVVFNIFGLFNKFIEKILEKKRFLCQIPC